MNGSPVGSSGNPLGSNGLCSPPWRGTASCGYTVDRARGTMSGNHSIWGFWDIRQLHSRTNRYEPRQHRARPRPGRVKRARDGTHVAEQVARSLDGINDRRAGARLTTRPGDPDSILKVEGQTSGESGSSVQLLAKSTSAYWYGSSVDKICLRVFPKRHGVWFLFLRSVDGSTSSEPPSVVNIQGEPP